MWRRPAADSHRCIIERGAIGLLSWRVNPAADPPSPTWLGIHAVAVHIRTPGLWNVNHVDEPPTTKPLCPSGSAKVVGRGGARTRRRHASCCSKRPCSRLPRPAVVVALNAQSSAGSTSALRRYGLPRWAAPVVIQC